MLQDAFFEKIEKHYSQQLPFVVLSKPKANSVKAYLQESAKLYSTEDFTESGFVFAPFDSTNEVVLIPENKSKILTLNTFEALANIIAKNTLNSSSDKEKHLRLVEKSIESIQSGEFSKIVVSRTEEVTITNSNPIRIFNNLLSLYPDAFVYCFYHPKAGLWLGATPETLLSVKGKRFSTMSLAGTQPYKGNLQVQWEQKEKDEQLIVTDFIMDGMLSSTSSIQSSIPETVKAGSLLHLQSKITGVLNETNLKQLITVLHPTPAVCGFPKEKAKQFIIENEGYNRAFYTGFLGELNQKERNNRNQNRRNVENNAYASVKNITTFFVNLRCMQLVNNKAILYVGGGITKDSIPEKEWQETVYKTTTIKNCLS